MSEKYKTVPAETTNKPEVKRYDCTSEDSYRCHGCFIMKEQLRGDYVEWEDYEALQADRDQQYDMKVKTRERRDAVTSKLKALQAECEKLVEALQAISRNELDAQRAQHVATEALAAHRKQGGYKADNYGDLAAYSALMGEAACDERNDGAVYSERTLQEVIGDADLSDWARWVAVDGDGQVYEYYDRPSVDICFPTMWTNSDDGWNWIKDIEPPSDFTKCIWEIKK